MQNSFRIVFYGFIFGLLLSSCGLKKKFLEDSYKKIPVALDLSIQEIRIFDIRKNVEDRELKIPIISFSGQRDSLSPPLSEQHQNLIKSEISSYFNNTGETVNVQCTILKALKRFSAKWSEEEYAEVELMMEIVDKNKTTIKSATSTAFLKMNSGDASQKYIEALFKKTIALAINKAFQELEKINLK